MRLRHGLILGLGAVLAATPAMAQTLATPPAGQPAVKRAAKPPARLAQSATPAAAPVTTANGANTLTGAFAASYSNNPSLQAERAKLRATDENVPQALSGWRPTVSLAGTAGYGDGYARQWLQSGVNNDARTLRDIGTAQATVTQPIYAGGHTRASTSHAENQVMAERARLLVQEQQTFSDTITAYVGVIQAQQILALNINNEQVLARQLQATNDRFRVGEITRTDVAQAEAALAGATAQRETAEGNLQTARAAFQRTVGYLPGSDLIEPQPLKLPIKGQVDAANLAMTNNPSVIAAMFDDAASKDNVDVAFSALMPKVALQGQTFQQDNASTSHSKTNGYQVVATVTVPIYQGGAEYSAVRQARQAEQQTNRLIDDAKRTAQQSAIQAWETLTAARATADSTRSQIRANQIALEGVQREAIVGSRTTLDVLNAEQLLLQSQVTLVQNLANVVTASYGVASAIGRLTARDLNLSVPLYDETAYYKAVRDKWVGTGDQAVDQPGR
jgi:outer membrane protein